jgi:alkanesulfonate monooxygenase SsuD/methylene tetrahydromethanopterin reductase-like flavin-dependent oxidoreductase (luciferase family)
MRLGLINQLHGRPDGTTPAPSWKSISERAAAAEAAGFDMFVFEDALRLVRMPHSGRTG